MLVQVFGDARSGDLALVHADVKTVGATYVFQNSHGFLGYRAYFSNFLGRRFIVGTDVAVGADQKVSAVVRVKVQKSKSALSPINNETICISFIRGQAKWTRILGWLRAILDVNHPVRGPQPLKVIGCPRHVPMRNCRELLIAHFLNLRLVFDGLQDTRNRFLDGDSVFLSAVAETE